MADLNNTEEELEQQLKFEGVLAFRIKRLFKQIVDNEVSNLRTFGSFSPASNYVNKIESTLKEHYINVMNKNSSSMLNSLGLSNIQKELLQDDLEQAMEIYSTEMAATHAAIIVNTNSKDMQKALDAALLVSTIAAKEGIVGFDYTDAFKSEYNSELDSRVETIAMTETQNATETSKKMTAASLASNLDSGVLSPASIGATGTGAALIDKTWVTILDGKEREAHRDAHGQKVSLTSQFTVMGESLDYPGDPKGSLENTINCRCKVKYSI